MLNEKAEMIDISYNEIEKKHFPQQFYNTKPILKTYGLLFYHLVAKSNATLVMNYANTCIEDNFA